jgi:hypothetical protein
MNQFTEKYTGAIRSSGWLLNGIGIGIVFSGSDWIQSVGNHDLFVLGLLVIVIGNFLRAAKTEEEKEKESQRKNDRYNRLSDRLGSNRVKITHKASIFSTLVLFCIAMSIMFSGSMSFVWPLIGLIVIGLILAMLTQQPVPTSRGEQRQSRAHS